MDGKVVVGGEGEDGGPSSFGRVRGYLGNDEGVCGRFLDIDGKTSKANVWGVPGRGGGSASYVDVAGRSAEEVNDVKRCILSHGKTLNKVQNSNNSQGVSV